MMNNHNTVPTHETMLQEAKDPSKANDRLNSLMSALAAKHLLTLVVEPTSKCNLACSFCDLHSGRIADVDHYKGHMTISTWENLVSQLEISGYKLKQLQLHGNGEPLLNKLTPRFIEIARRKNIAESIRVTTNGTLLTPSILEKIVEAGADEIRVSVDAGDAGTWEKFKGKKLFKNLQKNVTNAIEYVAKRPNIKLVLKYPVVSGDQDLSYGVTEYFRESVIQSFASKIASPNVVLSAMPVVTLMDGVLLQNKKNFSPCEIPFYSLFVKFDGRVSVCCADVTNLLDMGKLDVEGLAGIVNGVALSEFRTKHLEGNFESIPLCLYCGNRTCVDLKPVAETVRDLIKR
jgi:organic radical activating enzyme